MVQQRASLHDDVMAAFERACHERKFDVAEHLLRAIETMANRADNEEWIQAAYLTIAKTAF